MRGLSRATMDAKEAGAHEVFAHVARLNLFFCYAFA
jgi:hypothetical protein